MSNAKFTGYAWHIEKVKGYNPKRKTCFNCIHFCKDDNSCSKNNIHVTNNNARYCISYENDFIEEKNELKKSSTTPEEFNRILKIVKENLKKVQERDIIQIKNIENGMIYQVKILPSVTGDEKVINEKCIDKKIGFKFSYKNNNFEIIDLKKKAISMDEKLSKLSKRKKSNLVIPDSNNPIEKLKTVEVKKIYKPIAEENDIFYFKTQACKKGASYSNETLKIKKGERGYRELIKRCIGKEVGYRCKFKNKMYKLIYIEKLK